MTELTTTYQNLVGKISESYLAGQKRAVQAVNTSLVKTYWEIGQHIVEFEQDGKETAEYGKRLLERLSRDLTNLYGKGFNRSNLNNMRKMYKCYPICATLSHKLSWSHYVELLKIEDELERSFYEKQTLLENWNVRELIRQKKTSLFLRLAASKDKEGILQLAQKGKIIEKPTDLLREPYILEFLNIPEPYQLSETDLEQHIIDNLQHFLLELGKGFAFIGRQYRIMLGNRPHYVDLVFYHRILKCFVLIDLKVEEAGYEDVGQMNMYMGYFAKEENVEGDNPPIGIVLARYKDELLIEYATYESNSQLFVQKYQLYLPEKEELRKILSDIPENI
ncbi:MAG: PDDEXK nuclease domain-containing protein [Flavobacteriaceae bacterium]